MRMARGAQCRSPLFFLFCLIEALRFRACRGFPALPDVTRACPNYIAIIIHS
jgi:hypothetical protein